MLLSGLVTERIRQRLASKDWEGIDTLVSDSAHFKERKARALMYQALNATILDYAFQHNSPEVLVAIRTIPPDGAEEFFSRLVKQYTKSGNRGWLDGIFILAEKLGKKSLKSKIIAGIVQNLISAGIEEANPLFIETGIASLNKISFRKYRSECTTEAASRLTRWALQKGNNTLLCEIYDLTNEVTDISKRAALHAEITEALATNAVKTEDLNLLLKSLHLTAQIHQKIRRRACMDHIIGLGMRSSLVKDLTDVRLLIPRFEDLLPEIQGELIDSLTEQFLERIKNKSQILENLLFLRAKFPFIQENLVQNLLIKAERSGDSWYLTTAIGFIQEFQSEEKVPVREIIRAGIGIARRTRSTSIIGQLIPFANESCSHSELTEIYLQFVSVMLELEAFEQAAALFSQITPDHERMPQYTFCLAHMLKMGITLELGSAQFREILENSTPDNVSLAVSLAMREMGQNTSFEEIAKHGDSLKRLLDLNDRTDSVITDFIMTLTSRGFLDSFDALFLVDLAKRIRTTSAREEAMSTVVMKLAEIGVRTKHRDILQQAVGITCMIEGENIRSSTLSSIIDDAALLAATQGDLDLLLRMRIWSSAFLDSSIVTYAIKNIVDGVIKYALSKRDPDALEEAYRIAQDIEDPALRIQISERIAESFVRIGCIRIQNATEGQKNHADHDALLHPFRKSLQLLKAEVKKPRISLKIAGMIDIILSFSKKSTDRDFVLPLALYALEIDDPLERNAMMLRIIAKLGEDIVYPDSADPYEILAYILQNRYNVRSTPAIIILIHHLLDLIQNPFIRLKGLCALAESTLIIHDEQGCQRMLSEVTDGVSSLPTEHEKILILAELTVGYHDIDPEMAQKCLQEGLDRLHNVEPDQSTLVHRKMVAAIVRAGDLLPEKTRLSLILEIIADISDPIEYVTALISAYTLDGEDQGRSTLRHISESLEKIDSPYNQALLTLKLIPLAVRKGEIAFALDLLNRAEQLSETINVQHVADSIRDEVARILEDLFRMQGDERYLKKSAEILALIEDDQLRQDSLARIGCEDTTEKNLPSTKIMATMTRLIDTGAPPGQIASLEQTVHAVPDRGKRALIYCRLSILFRENGEIKTARRMLQNAINESEIIRPLSKRAYIRCDMAIKMFTAGYESVAQDILDQAIDAATNIRQSILRDEVFNELGMAIRILQGGEPE